MNRHSVIRLEVDSAVQLEDVLQVKREMEREVRHIHHMQTVVIDLQEKGYQEECECCHEHEHGHECCHEHEHHHN